MDRRLHAVQDRLAEQCAQTFKTVQGSVSAVTSVSFLTNSRTRPDEMRAHYSSTHIFAFELSIEKRHFICIIVTHSLDPLSKQVI